VELHELLIVPFPKLLDGPTTSATVRNEIRVVAETQRRALSARIGAVWCLRWVDNERGDW